MSKSVQRIPFDNKTGRVETGAVQFGEDWPGLFIRGDNAFALAINVQALLEWYNELPEHVKGEFMVSQAISGLRSFQQIIMGDVIA
jgi:hypothetical protein